MNIQNEIIEVRGRRWKIREARSMKDALDEIAMAGCTGSIGGKTTLDETLCGGGVTVLADVVQVNSDDTERQAYSTVY